MTREELNRPGRKVGVSTGSASMLIVEKELPEAEIVYFEDNVSAYEAVAREFPLSRRRRKGFLEALQSSGIRM